MDNPALPTGLMPLFKAATRQAVLAAGGPARVKALTGLSDGMISRMQGDAYPDMIPAWAMALLEFETQQPIFARMLATLTSHQVVPVAAGGDGEGCLVNGLVATTRSGAEVTATLGAALADNTVTPREARDTLAVIHRHEAVLTPVKRRLAAVAGGRA